jgi:NADH:ubiquinone oxidoreductase subunit F (NADH-binding)
MVLGEAGCAVHETAAVLDYLARESAHQCGPCRNGLPAIAALVADMADGRAPRDAGATLRRWSAQIRRRGACSLPDGAVRFLASALEVFAADFADHERHGPCEHCRRPPTVAVAPPAPEVAA